MSKGRVVPSTLRLATVDEEAAEICTPAKGGLELVEEDDRQGTSRSDKSAAFPCRSSWRPAVSSNAFQGAAAAGDLRDLHRDREAIPSRVL